MTCKLLIFSGPSGAGKTSLKNRLINNPKILVGFSASDTTRKRRENEVHGVDYYFTTEIEMKKGFDRGEFYEKVVYNGQIYGTRYSYFSLDSLVPLKFPKLPLMA